jgi:hypothetical protein
MITMVIYTHPSTFFFTYLTFLFFSNIHQGFAIWL